MKLKNLFTLTVLTTSVLGGTANATDVDVHIQNLSTEVIQTSDSGFPRYLAPGESGTVTLNFPNTGSSVNFTYTSASGKTCSFRGGHRSYGDRAERKADAVGSQSYNNCGAIVTARKWSSPFHYRLGFWMTD
ncbi:hypothetical protein [Pseudomonas graminis]|jgi:hypothetical protein|uniref:hypothetical protein n=1 Tax=Pseudomonas graminis TaxID=158627 RepID=UPI00114CB501|nr:hypothetical protein [Pseudomonas graminis]